MSKNISFEQTIDEQTHQELLPPRPSNAEQILKITEHLPETVRDEFIKEVMFWDNQHALSKWDWKECWKNTQTFMMFNRLKGAVYCEGTLSIPDIPFDIDHSWVEYRGFIIDFTRWDETPKTEHYKTVLRLPKKKAKHSIKNQWKTGWSGQIYDQTVV